MQRGRCLCEALVFEVTGEPRDVINCHCHFCQRATGSAYLVESIFENKHFRQLRGVPTIYTHRSVGSGKHIHLHFCASCGTKTYMRFERFPDIVGVFSGAFDEKDWFERTRENALHFFLSNAHKGTVLPAGFEVYDGHYWISDGVPDTPHVFDRHTLVTEELCQESLSRLQDRDAQK